MYCSYYGIQEKPFSITPDPKYLYLGKTHKEAFAHLIYGIRERGGFIVITGEIGTGKTTLCRALLNHLDSDTLVAFIINPTLSALELLKSINEDFGLPSGGGTKKELIDELNRFLLEKREQGKNTVLMIDEAQNLDMEVLEHIRLLSNLETDTEKLIQIILIGQPEFREMLEQPRLLQLDQRVTVRYHLSPLSKEETGAYIRHRLAVAGAEDKIRFSPDAVKRIGQCTRGVPRLINVLCDRALLMGYGQRTRDINKRMINPAYAEVAGRERIQAFKSFFSVARRGLVPGLTLALVVILIAFMLNHWYFRDDAGFKGMEKKDRAGIVVTPRPSRDKAEVPARRIARPPSAGAVQGTSPEKTLPREVDVPVKHDRKAVEPQAVQAASQGGSQGENVRVETQDNWEGPVTVATVEPDQVSIPGASLPPEEEEPLSESPDVLVNQQGVQPVSGGDASKETTVAVLPDREEGSRVEGAAVREDETEKNVDEEAALRADPKPRKEGELRIVSGQEGEDGLRKNLLLSLSEQTVRATRDRAIRAVVNEWMRYTPVRNSDGSGILLPDIFKAAQNLGFHCYRLAGDMDRIKAMNLPAILDLRLGERLGKRYVALVSLKGSHAEISPALADGTRSLPLKLLEDYWQGTAYILWKDWVGGRGLIVNGMRGDAVDWLQGSLQDLGYRSVGPSGVYDLHTWMAVRRFQRDRDLDEDGVFGPQTKICLFHALRHFRMPALEVPDKNKRVAGP